MSAFDQFLPLFSRCQIVGIDFPVRLVLGSPPIDAGRVVRFREAAQQAPLFADVVGIALSRAAP
jgi:hypothetical protein